LLLLLLLLPVLLLLPCLQGVLLPGDAYGPLTAWQQQ
jgi:hypothetical protein